MIQARRGDGCGDRYATRAMGRRGSRARRANPGRRGSDQPFRKVAPWADPAGLNRPDLGLPNDREDQGPSEPRSTLMIGKNNWLLEAVQTADEPRAPWIRGVVASAVENPAIKAAILAIVDQKKPGGVEVWITGSRAKGNNRPDSDWDVVVLHPKAKPIL